MKVWETETDPQIRERAEAISYFSRAFAERPESGVYVGKHFDEQHKALQSRYDISARALREIKRRMAAEMKAKGLPGGKQPRAKRVKVCPHCSHALTAA